MTGIRQQTILPLSKMEVHSAIYDCKILNLFTTKPCFEIVHESLVSVQDKGFKNQTSQIPSPVLVV